MKYEAGPSEITFRHLIERRTKGFERAYHAVRILRRRLDPHIEIAGGPRLGVEGERVRSDDQKADVSVDERAQQIDKVLVHRETARADATVLR